ncbi:MAG TPA: Hpt domain-containing protein [Burkholderiales bacterium]|jgi:HPt (histidine-containing phosphotransfer) domain-containing protein|nr:Hpt domain-containing protein [Burkholderiales bacterium]
MTQDVHTVKVSKDLEDLIPTFLANRKKELDTLRQALTAADFEQIRQIGHRMRGVGNSYGFDNVTSLGKLIEDGAKASDRAGLETHIAAYGEYLSNVRITYE